MGLLYEIDFETVCYHYLKAEWYSSQYDYLRKLEPTLFKLPEAIENAGANARLFRSVIAVTRKTLLDSLPGDIRWYHASVDKSYFEGMLVILEKSWHEEFGEIRTLRSIADIVKGSMEPFRYHTKKILDIYSNIGTHEFSEKLIGIKTDIVMDPVVIFEGNHRAVAFMLHTLNGFKDEIPKQMIFGVSPGMRNCKFYM